MGVRDVVNFKLNTGEHGVGDEPGKPDLYYFLLNMRGMSVLVRAS